MKWAVACEGLTKCFGKVAAVDKLNLQLKPDKIYGLLGRNGAGKTTLLNMLTTHWYPTGGLIRIFDEDPVENAPVLEKICMVQEKNQFIQSLRVGEIIAVAERFYPSWDAALARKLLDTFELDTKKRCKSLSRGMESSLGIVIGMASRAPLTIFDEPSLGLDAVNRQQFYDLLLDDYTRYPRTVILSTHLIDEVSNIFEEIIIIDRGRVKVKEETETLRRQAFYLNGDSEAVDALACDLTVLHSEEYGKTRVTAVLGELDAGAREQASANGVDISLIPVQKLFIFLTELYKKEASAL